MYKNEIEITYNEIQNLVFERKMADAIEKLGTFIKESHSFDQQLDYESLISNYQLMLEYLVKGNVDSERQKVYEKLSGNLLEINDKARQNAFFYCPELPQYKSKNYYSNQGKLTSDTAITIFEKIISVREINLLLKNTDIKNEESSFEDQLNQGIEELFRLFWLTDKYDEVEKDLFLKIIDSESFFWFEKSLMVSAVTLGLINTLDINKISLLIKAYTRKIPKVSERAFTGLILSLYKYDKRLKYYPAIQAELMLLSDELGIKDDARIVISQLLEAKDTEKLTKKIQEEIMPDVIKHAPGLMQKIDEEDIFTDSDDDEKDPKWKSIFKDSPELYEKFEELSKLQMKGGDMFMGAFSHLKHFQFFHNLTNWLLPFYASNTALANVFGSGAKSASGEQFLDAMENSPHICNSDKYSFCFNLKALPEQQRNMLTEVFIAEMNSVSEILYEDGKINQNISKRYVTIQYIQDLYRFFKLNPYKFHFEDVFEWKLDFYNTSFFDILFDGKTFLNEIASFYFEKEYYKDALIIFLKLNQSGYSKLELLQKIAFCYQKLKDFSQAIDYYNKADLAESGNAWTLKKLAFCYRKLGDYEKALNCYLEIEKSEPDDAQTQIKLGQIYFSLDNGNEALKHYYKADFLSPDNIKVLRPLAWICLTQTKVEDARRLYEKIPNQELNFADLINLGHIEWLSGHRTKAVDYYYQSLVRNPSGYLGFSELFNQDIPVLMKIGYNAEEIPLLLDYIKTFRSSRI